MIAHDWQLERLQNNAGHSSRVPLVLWTLFAVLTAFVVAGHFRAYFKAGFIPDDLRAFYCAGKVVLQRHDPYRVEPLLSCERRLDFRKSGGEDTVIPVPLPGYDFMPLAALATLPMRVAVMFIAGLLLAATAITAYCLTRMAALPIIASFAICFMGITYGASQFGQIAPIAIAAVAAAALFMRNGKPKRAALCAAVSAVQPQFGLPIMLAMFLFVPRARAIIAVIAAALVFVTEATVGTRGAMEYLTVLAIHSRSEINYAGQYSLSWLAHALGTSTDVALMLGTLSYLALVTASLLVLARCGGRAITTGAVVLLPAAFSVLGGSFIHAYQMSVAILAAIVLVAPLSVVISPMLGAALLAVPFDATATSTLAAAPSWLLAVIGACCAVFFPTRALGRRTAIKSAAVAGVIVAGVLTLLLVFRPQYDNRVIVHSSSRHDAAAMASTEWARRNDAAAKHDSTPMLYYVLLKFPTWCGVALTLLFASRTLLSEPLSRLNESPLVRIDGVALPR